MRTKLDNEEKHGRKKKSASMSNVRAKAPFKEGSVNNFKCLC
jgi:hypothetical protein